MFSDHLTTNDDTIWSTDPERARSETEYEPLRQALIDRFDGAGELPALLPYGDDQWIALYYRDPALELVYWTGR